MFNFTWVSIAALCTAIYFIFTQATSLIKRRHFAKAYGCKPPVKFPQPERILGIHFFNSLQSMMKSKTLLSTGVEWHRAIGNTFSATVLGQSAIATVEPENVKAVLATQFHDFGIGTRYRAMGALLGHGIFASDGSRWEHSRVTMSIHSTKDLC
jgi:hypothetical protein